VRNSLLINPKARTSVFYHCGLSKAKQTQVQHIFPDKWHVQLKRPRIVPGEEVDEKSKKVGHQLLFQFAISLKFSVIISPGLTPIFVSVPAYAPVCCCRRQ
jgi:hypothetical protein